MKEPLIRLVKMTLRPDRVEDFLNLFDNRSSAIRAFPGCLRLDLLQDVERPNVVTTFSLWESVDALEAYRSSNLFKETWALTKTMFDGRPEAASFNAIRRIEPDFE